MGHGFTVHDAAGRVVPLLRIHPSDPALDGLGFFKSKRLKKLWKKIRKPLVGAAVLGAGVLTGGAALAAAPAVIGAVTGGASALLPGAAAAVLPGAAALIGGGAAPATAMAAEAVPVMAAASSPAPMLAPAPIPAAAPARRKRQARTVGYRRGDGGGLSGPLLIGGGLAALALVLLVQRSSSGKA